MMMTRRTSRRGAVLLLLFTTVAILLSSHTSSAIAAEAEAHHHPDAIDVEDSPNIDSIIDNDEVATTVSAEKTKKKKSRRAEERVLDAWWPTHYPTTYWEGDEWSPTKKPTSWSKPTRKPTRKPSWNDWSPTHKPTRKPTWNEWPSNSKPTRKPTRKPISWSKPTNKPSRKPSRKPTNKPTNKPSPKPTNKPTWKSGGSDNGDKYSKYRIYTKQDNPVGYNEEGWDKHFWWKDVIEDVRGECAAMFYEDLEYVAKAIRLSFHDCKGHSEGYGCDGCVNLNHIDNIGLEGIMEKLRPIVERYEEHLSRADTWILCALTALEISTSRTYPMNFIGRKSCEDSDDIGDGGENHGVYGDEVHTHQLVRHFTRYFGFDAKCTVAVMGLHGISKMRPENSGHGNGPYSATWVRDASYKMTNDYFKGFEYPWTYEERDNEDYPKFGEQSQWYNGAYDEKRLVLLNVDIALKWNFEEYVDDKGRIYCKVSDEANHHGGKDPKNVPECPRAYQTYNTVRDYADDYGLFLNDLEYCMIQMYTTGYRDGYDNSYFNYYGDGRTAY
mmetsp:Transcript_22905/g.34125  ORF Transcript_22905/g.34125 Transcript_22905/m.34125 type:complete len:554 (-) Transcript_22905:88-1749(-)